jgi:hypothetical protein
VKENAIIVVLLRVLRASARALFFPEILRVSELTTDCPGPFVVKSPCFEQDETEGTENQKIFAEIRDLFLQ